MTPDIRIGNQTSVWCPDPMGPFRFALEHGFDAFEWFADKKENADGTFRGWDEHDLDAAARAAIRRAGTEHGFRFTVHAPWQANPLNTEGVDHLLVSLDFARDIGADLVNLHLYMEADAAGYAAALRPVLRAAEQKEIRLSIENTPHTTPEDFNRTFAELGRLAPPGLIGMCLDLGHANLCAATHNDYLAYLDALDPNVPIIHLHLHENYGDRDSHLPLFTGPSREDDRGVRAFVGRLLRRGYRGAMILEQWPDPPELLVAAAARLRGLLDGHASAP